MQIVYISNRPSVLLETLNHVAAFMTFVKRVVVCAPDAMAKALPANQGRLPLTILAESEILSAEQVGSLNSLDHQRRNYLLRTEMARHDALDAEFIMSDDDARPLKEISLHQFIENDRHHLYYFYQLRQWDNNQTEFDAGQHSSFAVLEMLGIPSLSYASHMPQIISRDLFLQSAAFFADYSRRYALCEWSSYFNYALSKHPNKFNDPRAYAVLCWPEHPLAWPNFVEVPEYLFENFSPQLYKQGAVFRGMATAFGIDTTYKNVEKLLKWRMYQIACRHPEQSESLLKYRNPRTWINKLLKHRL